MSEAQKPIQAADSLHHYRGDAPITSLAEDRLGRARFASQIAAAVTNWREDRGLVIGLYGPWGSGKTSILNMVEESLSDATEKPGPEVLRFNPWEWSGQENLQRIFFTEIGAKLPLLLQGDPFQPVPLSDLPSDEKPGWELLWMDVQRLCHALDRTLDRTYSRVTRWFYGGNREPPPLKQLWDDYASVIATSSALGSARDLAPWAGIGFAKAAVDVRKLQAEWKLAGLKERGQSTIHTARELLVNQLDRRIRNLVVIIDDVDRLSPDQLVQMFQLVKANGDLPGLIYLIAIPREQVEQALQSKGFGKDYLQKIVQVPLTLPKPNPQVLRQQVESGIQERISRYPGESGVDPIRWEVAWDVGLGGCFDSPRSVVRYLDALAYHMAVLSKGDMLEVDPTDLAILEVIRLCFPELHREMGQHEELFVPAHSGADISTHLERARNTLKRTVPESPANRDWLLTLWTDLSSVLSQAATAEQLSKQIARGERLRSEFIPPQLDLKKAEASKRRLANRDVFPRFFELQLDESDVSSHDLRMLILSRADSASFAVRLRALVNDSQERLWRVLDRILSSAEVDGSVSLKWVTALNEEAERLAPAQVSNLECEGRQIGMGALARGIWRLHAFGPARFEIPQLAALTAARETQAHGFAIWLTLYIHHRAMGGADYECRLPGARWNEMNTEVRQVLADRVARVLDCDDATLLRLDRLPEVTVQVGGDSFGSNCDSITL